MSETSTGEFIVLALVLLFPCMGRLEAQPPRGTAIIPSMPEVPGRRILFGLDSGTSTGKDALASFLGPQDTQAPPSQRPTPEPAKVPAPASDPPALPAPEAVLVLHSPLAVAKTDGQLGWLGPESRYKTRQGISKLHLGVDFQAAYREPVYAMADGEVVYRRTDVTNFGGDALPGGALVIKHLSPEGKTFYALYGHLEKPTRVEAVTAGQVIGRVGHYYFVSGGQLVDKPHLHIGVYVGGTPPSNPFLAFIDPAARHSRWVDPLTLISGAKRE